MKIRAVDQNSRNKEKRGESYCAYIIKIISVAQYKIIYSIWDHVHARTQNSQFVTIKGSDGETDEQLCDADFNVINQDVLCVFESPANIGDYRCVSLRTGGSDGIDLTKVIDCSIMKLKVVDLFLFHQQR